MYVCAFYYCEFVHFICVHAMVQSYGSIMFVCALFVYASRCVLVQLQHALQTAEACRAKYPGAEYEWLHLTCLIHDLGKFMFSPNSNSTGLPQEFVVGDTFPLGCRFDEANIFYDTFKDNPDFKDKRYNSVLGVYKQNCGLSQVRMSWG